MHRSITTILWNKLLDHIEKQELSTLINRGIIVILSLIFALILSTPQETAEFARMIRLEKPSAILLGLPGFFMMMNLGRIYDIINGIDLGFTSESTETRGTFEGIPAFELLDHLFVHGTFKRADVEKKFGIPRYKVQEISEAMESVGILTRGSNNARVLNTEMTRSQVAQMINRSEGSAKNLSHSVQLVQDGQYTTSGVASLIKNKVNQLINSTNPNHFLDERNMVQT